MGLELRLIERRRRTSESLIFADVLVKAVADTFPKAVTSQADRVEEERVAALWRGRRAVRVMFQ